MENPLTFTIREITSSDDPAWPIWVELYLGCFPYDERVPVSYFLDLFTALAEGERMPEHIWVMEQFPAGADPQETGSANVVGMAFTEFEPESALAFLWYIATKPGVRNQGYGTILYDYLAQTFQKQQAKVMLIEVEMPDAAEDPVVALRRINWYRRLGAQVIQGIRYFQFISPDILPKEMWLMAHLFASLDAVELFALTKAYFTEYVSQQETVRLE
ncbi:MAG: GNAT family N-acetyltransferase [Chloroflexi bacterium]|nr:GNAT family N-acetyltransferase [Chloroflexota bacterium]